MSLHEALIVALVLSMVVTFFVGAWFYLARPRHPEDLGRMIWALLAMLGEAAALILVISLA